MNKEHVAQLIKDVVGSANLKTDELLKDHTSFKVGGPADIFVIPRGREQLTGIIDICKNSSIPYYVIGNGTNLIVRDKGIRGVVIKISEGFRNYSVEDDIITAEAGLLLSEVSNIALNHELTGLEFASGIPGTLGGAVAMNAGAYTGEMKDAVIKTQYMDLDGKIKTVRGEEHKFGYRRSFAQETGGIVLMSCLQLKKGSKSDIRELMNEFNRRRKEKQPIHMPSAGSVFKRPEGYFAGKLIEDCDLKGCGIGGAEVSSMHCGFIVNKGNATADDIIRLIKHVQVAVKEKFGVDLEREVRILGEE